jgi:hypothetical protein
MLVEKDLKDKDGNFSVFNPGTGKQCELNSSSFDCFFPFKK